jgi:hypothetical protein
MLQQKKGIWKWQGHIGIRTTVKVRSSKLMENCTETIVRTDSARYVPEWLYKSLLISRLKTELPDAIETHYHMRKFYVL